MAAVGATKACTSEVFVAKILTYSEGWCPKHQMSRTHKLCSAEGVSYEARGEEGRMDVRWFGGLCLSYERDSEAICGANSFTYL